MFPFSLYRKRIIEATACTEAEAVVIEADLRDTYSTLDGLTAAQLKRAARKAYATIRKCEVCGKTGHNEEKHTPANV